MEKLFSLSSVIEAGLSGYFAIAKQDEPFPIHHSESGFLRAFRTVVYSDETLAIFLIQLAVVSQALGTLSHWISALLRF